MAKSITHIRKKRGRPPVGAVQLNVRVPPDELKVLDRWIKAQLAPRPSRPEALRRLCEYALQRVSWSEPLHTQVAKASEPLPDSIRRLVERGLKAKGE